MLHDVLEWSDVNWCKRYEKGITYNELVLGETCKMRGGFWFANGEGEDIRCYGKKG